MKITVEISLYPLDAKYSEPIKDFIKRLKKHKNLEIEVNATSTQIVGEHTHVFDVLKEETAQSFQAGVNVFVMKVLGFERDIEKDYD